MARNYPKGVVGDAINAMLASAAYNLGSFWAFLGFAVLRVVRGHIVSYAA